MLLVGHLSLAPVAWFLRGIGRISSYVVILHGVEAWSGGYGERIRPGVGRQDHCDDTIHGDDLRASEWRRSIKFLVIPLLHSGKARCTGFSFELKGE